MLFSFHLNYFNFSSDLLPNNDEIDERAKNWEKLFDKFSKCNDTEEDGMDIDDLVACAEGKFMKFKLCYFLEVNFNVNFSD